MGANDDDEFRFNDASIHEDHLRQNGVLTSFSNETAVIMSHICIKCKTRTNLTRGPLWPCNTHLSNTAL